jgi:DNA-binding HxlR family transcriptional regulator
VLKETAPQYVEYALTDLGKTLQEPLAAICDWAASQIAVSGSG